MICVIYPAVTCSEYENLFSVLFCLQVVFIIWSAFYSSEKILRRLKLQEFKNLHINQEFLNNFCVQLWEVHVVSFPSFTTATSGNIFQQRGMG